MYESILVPTDGSEGAAQAAERALDMAELHDSTVHVLYVVDVRMSPVDESMDHDEVVELLEEVSGKPTTPIVERARDRGVAVVETIRIGVPFESIQAYLSENDIDIVVMGTHGRTGLEHTFLGSTAERIVRTANVPVLTVPFEAV
ncbi:universal stress protein [Haloarchaeobius sp. FL176]|uniref:universal stress protein n=1 Tax=Haloarchaeobius sp. FL176 TaxID=2967129 RepID=UPI0021483D1C|nr:universal stress protein [Haloarchaeobius sp. FL176]